MNKTEYKIIKRAYLHKDDNDKLNLKYKFFVYKKYVEKIFGIVYKTYWDEYIKDLDFYDLTDKEITLAAINNHHFSPDEYEIVNLNFFNWSTDEK